jgi:hypothetical protein
MALNVGKEVAALKRMADVLAESRRQREEAIGKLEVERRVLEREIGRHTADLRKLAGQNGAATDRKVKLVRHKQLRGCANIRALSFFKVCGIEIKIKC